MKLNRDFSNYIGDEVLYHEKRYLEGEARAAKLAAFCGSVAAILSAAFVSLLTRTTLIMEVPRLSVALFLAAVVSLLAAVFCALAATIPIDKHGNFSRPWRVRRWTAGIAQAMGALTKTESSSAIDSVLDQHSEHILWVARHPGENIELLVLRSKIYSLLAFKRSIGHRQQFTTLSIVTVSLAIALFFASVTTIASLAHATPSGARAEDARHVPGQRLVAPAHGLTYSHGDGTGENRARQSSWRTARRLRASADRHDRSRGPSRQGAHRARRRGSSR